MTTPLTQKRVIELYYLEHRAKILDIAAFLDRFDRAEADENDGEDFRVRSLREALSILSEGESGRAKRVLELFSDPTREPLESAAGLKGAYGSYPGRKP
jgi:hypothetical protein